MSDTTAIAAVTPPSPGPTTPTGAKRPLSDEIDLYAEGAAFSEADWAGPGIEAVFGEDGFDFKDLLDIVNPLQHLPVVGTIYRALTDDTLEPGARVVGGTLYGGIGGFVTAIANAVYENETGKDVGAAALALITGDGTTDTAVAQADTAPAAAAQSAATTPDIAAQPAAASRITPTAPSPLALAGHAAASLPAPGGETADPVSALLQAQAAVPQTQRPGATGLPPTNFRGSLAVGDGETLPIQFRSGTARATPQEPSHAPAKHAPQPVATPPDPAPPTPTETASAKKTNAPRPLIAQAEPPDTTQEPPRKTSGKTPSSPHPAPMPDVALRMQSALDKYETLMKSRTAPSISSEI
jgi:hypothetical protein